MMKLTLVCVLLCVIKLVVADDSCAGLVDIQAIAQIFVDSMTVKLNNVDVNSPAGIQSIEDHVKQNMVWNIQLLDSNKEGVCGIQELVNFWTNQKKAAGDGQMSFTVTESYSVGDFAYAFIEGHISGSDIVGRALMLFKHVGGQWKVVKHILNYYQPTPP